MTLEEFLERECGLVTPKMLELLEEHREFVETATQNELDSETIWNFLPELKDEHYHP